MKLLYTYMVSVTKDVDDALFDGDPLEEERRALTDEACAFDRFHDLLGSGNYEFAALVDEVMS